MAKAGSAYVDIDADLKKMRATLAKGTADLRADVELDPDMNDLRAKLRAGRLMADLGLDIDRSKIQAQLSGLTTNLRLDVDRTDISAQLMALGVDVNVKPDYSSLMWARSEIVAYLSGIWVDVNVRLDATMLAALQGQLAALSAQASGIGSSAGVAAAGGSMGVGALALGAGLLGGAAIGGVVGLGAYGASLASDIELADMALSRFMGSSEAAQAHLEDLKNFAKTTPFEFTGLRAMDMQLQAVGVSADDTIPILTMLGDATAATGTGQEGLARGSYALMQVMQKGTVQADEMRQLAQAGVPAWEALAAQMGVSVEEAMKMVEARQVPAETLFDALKNRAGDAFQRIQGGMAEAATTLSGQLSNLKDAFDIGLGEASMPFMDSMKGVVGVLATEVAPAIYNALGPALDSLGPFLSTLAEGLGPVLGQFLSVGGALLEAFQPALDVLMPALQTFAGLIGERLKDLLITLAPAFESLAKAAVSLIEPLMPVLGILADLAATILPPLAELVADVAQVFSDALTPVLMDLRPVIQDMAEQMMARLAEVLPELAPAIADLAEAFVQLLPPLLPVIEQIALLSADMSVELLDVLVALTPSLVNLIDAFVQLLPIITPLIPPLAELSLSILTVMAEVLTRAAPLLEWLTEGLSLAAGAVGAVLGSGIERVVDALMMLFDGDWDGLSEWWDSFSEDFSNGWDMISTKFGEAWESIKQTFKAGLNTIIGWWNDLRIPTIGPFTVSAFGVSQDIGPFGPYDLPDIPTFHTGGTFQAPMGQQEGLALLRNNEVIFTPEQMDAMSRSGGSSEPIVVPVYLDGREIARATTDGFNTEERLRR